MRAARLLAAACLVLAAAAPARAEEPMGLTARLGATLDAFRADYGFPGATAALALPDGRLVTAATGFADVEAGREMTPGTRMLAASIGKTVVAATVACAGGYRTTRNFINRAYLVAGKLRHLPESPCTTKSRMVLA
ncbi:hypothetical protein DLJ49_05370 [Rhodovulum sp. 12E13]|uniref:serine hydrolase n=1 Tax=Rhodovulum sp. 12E13 TaxID=2203891 RepID=UPI000E15AFE5|nr:serine hydrolase [Rhodovulum sp. 12E13]RDC74101.1 hypothetical protein DLJ49_05370 [Rhodovulum sp. 12E13]